jgi:transposase InsO family protein
MSWQEKTTMSLRQEFVQLAQLDAANIRLLCRRFQISPKTGYKWLARYGENGESGLRDRSRRPQSSPAHTDAAIEQRVLTLRAEHPTWGPRKLRVLLEREAVSPLPATSTLSAILKRHGQIAEDASLAHRPFERFEHAAPNQLWQMDFKGHFALQRGRCHPLTVLDDHSRFSLGLEACPNEQTPTVQTRLRAIFTRYGLPVGMLMDNGGPWGSNQAVSWTALTVWLVRLGIAIHHGRPYHPQTQGKEERFHRTLAEDVIAQHVLLDLAHTQAVFDRWRDEYNLVRPHEALALAVPASRYQPSPRSLPDRLPPLEYNSGEEVRKVQTTAEIYFRGRTYKIGHAFAGLPVALRPTEIDGTWAVYLGHQRIKTLDERATILDN